MGRIETEKRKGKIQTKIAQKHTDDFKGLSF
jgi:hypothetical protein